MPLFVYNDKTNEEFIDINSLCYSKKVKVMQFNEIRQSFK